MSPFFDIRAITSRASSWFLEIELDWRNGWLALEDDCRSE
jgi:hypothetical protein